MSVEVLTQVVIDRPRAEVAAYAADPDNATRWYVNIKSVEWQTPRPLAVGSRIAFVAEFLGRRLEYVYEITQLEPERRLVMRTPAQPFPMETTYTWEDADGGGTLMTLENSGAPSGVSRLATPFIARSMRRANRKDLDLLKRILEPGAQE
ncbi:MAG TPA: SRPBCC family protein [Gaiellales bacterium]|nr:SRPBCC family protein [Gaiellales bacterium]